VLLNYAPVVSLELALDAAVHILVVNETEAQQLARLPVRNPQEAEVAARKLLGNGHKIVVVTLGKAGAMIADAAGTRLIPAFAATAVDTTAAGDTFCGTLAVALVEGMPLDQAARFASAASAICVSRLGAQPSIPRRNEIDALLQSQ
jgi:ribokinase